MSLSVGSSITITVYTDFLNSPGSLKGTEAEELWPALSTGTDQLVSLYDDSYGRSEFQMLGIVLGPSGLDLPRTEAACEFKEHFAELARRLGRAADLSLFTDYAAEIELYEMCFEIASRETSSSRTCPAPIAEIADRVSRSQPEPTIVTIDQG